jgi:hypothetical protein
MPKRLQGFDVVLEAARTLPGVEQSTTWGTDALKVHGRLLACRAIHKSAEPNSIVVKIPVDQREELIAAEPDVYYLTEHYENYPSVLVRLSQINRDALRDLLGMALKFADASAKTRKRRARRSR